MAPADFSRPACRLPLFVTALIAAFIGGCSSDQGTLHLISQDGRHELIQKFSQAYLARDETGDADIVLIQDDLQPSRSGCAMPRQLIHIRIFWTPMTGVKPDHPANTNAAINWCLVCNNSDHPGVVEYRGSGLVEVEDSSDGALVTIRKAWMKAGCQHGQLVDPLGPSILHGSFRAQRDTGQVKAIIAEIKAAAAPNTPVQAHSAPVEQPKNLAVDTNN
ncbi:MAG TPA: hypothetical protein VHX86_10015 [Tepidisphaeraceae bacterium]|nr:hypothetical protein [Tepidisphaeraceae bacterium]